MGIISLFSNDEASKIESRLLAIELAVASLPVKIAEAQKTVLRDVFEKDIDANFKRLNAIECELSDLPEKIAAYEKIYLKSVLKEIDPESVAAELDEAQALLAAFCEEAKKIVATKEKEAQEKAYMAELEESPEGWTTPGEIAEKYNITTSRASLILRSAGITNAQFPRASVQRQVTLRRHYRTDEAERAVKAWKNREAIEEDSE